MHDEFLCMMVLESPSSQQYFVLAPDANIYPIEQPGKSRMNDAFSFILHFARVEGLKLKMKMLKNDIARGYAYWIPGKGLEVSASAPAEYESIPVNQSDAEQVIFQQADPKLSVDWVQVINHIK